MFPRKSAVLAPGVQVLINSKKRTLALNKPRYSCAQSYLCFSLTPRASSDSENQNWNSPEEVTQDKMKGESQRGHFLKRRRHLTPGVRVASLIPQQFWEERGENRDEIARETGSLQEKQERSEGNGNSNGKEVPSSDKGFPNKNQDEESDKYDFRKHVPHFKSGPQSLQLGRRRSLSVTARFDQLLQNGEKDDAKE